MIKADTDTFTVSAFCFEKTFDKNKQRSRGGVFVSRKLRDEGKNT